MDAPLADQTREAIALTTYGVESRYPGDHSEPSSDEVHRALAVAERVREAVLQHLPREFGAGSG